MSTSKRPRRVNRDTDGTSSERTELYRASWPRIEGLPIKSTHVWDDEPAVETLSLNCVQRQVLEIWDEYDVFLQHLVDH